MRLLAAELGRARHPGQRGQPRRRGARLRHLRRRLGRPARRGLRRAGGGARRLLRPAHAAQAGGAARARRQRGLRPHRRRPVATRRGCTSRSTPVSPRPSCGEPTDGARRPTSARSTSAPPAAGSCSARSGQDVLDLTEVHRFANRPVAGRGDAALGRPRACTPGSVDGHRGRRPGSTRRLRRRSASTPGRSTTGCSTRPAQLLGNPVHYRDAPHRRGHGRGGRRLGADVLYAANGLQLLPFNTIYQLASARGTARSQAARPAAADPRPARATG